MSPSRRSARPQRLTEFEAHCGAQYDDVMAFVEAHRDEMIVAAGIFIRGDYTEIDPVERWFNSLAFDLASPVGFPGYTPDEVLAHYCAYLPQYDRKRKRRHAKRT